MEPVGTPSKARAQWLLAQITTSRPITELSPEQKTALESDWAVFLEGEGLSRDDATRFATAHGISVHKLQQALTKLKTLGRTQTKFVGQRSWELLDGRITFAYGRQDVSPHDGFVLTIAMECLARHYRLCLRDKCKELFLAKRKKKYCSPKCALTVAKANYRARKRGKPAAS
ncbi:MAG: hypothetical protein NDI90_11175 [Nitrospira sp. BO4]|nr:hypothetical protein [Nitrospira sp. BO4]